jgi:hypothetical protein
MTWRDYVEGWKELGRSLPEALTVLLMKFVIPIFVFIGLPIILLRLITE